MTNVAHADVAHPDLVVVGGGIGGLATANALATAGHSVRLLEAAPEFGEVGAGLQLAPNATRLLREWGLLDEVVEAGVTPRRLILRDALTGAELTHLDLDDRFRERYQAPYVVVHRTDLHSILLQACRRAGVALETNRHVDRVDSTASGATTRCSDGSVYQSSAVLGMDGLMSTLRGEIVDDEAVTNGYVAYRGTVALEDAAVDIDADNVVAYVGPHCHLVQYTLRRGTVVNQVAVFRSPAYARGEAEWGGPDELDGAFENCCGYVRESLVMTRRDRFWPMYDRAPIDHWVRGRLGLLGDAAHPMLQYLAQGACQALEDAYVIADEVARYSTPGADGRARVDWTAAMESAARRRYPRTARIQRAARTWGESWHLDGVGRLVRNELFMARDTADLSRVDWLYGLDVLADGDPDTARSNSTVGVS